MVKANLILNPNIKLENKNKTTQNVLNMGFTKL
jgi:hypothetical protein